MHYLLRNVYSWGYNQYIQHRAKHTNGWQIYHSRQLGLNLLLNCDHLIDFLIREKGVFEEEVLEAVNYFYQKRDFLFIDIGSQLGQFSLYVKSVYPASEVLSFEPNIPAYEQQRANMLINRLHYILEPKALGYTKGTTYLHLPPDTWRDAYGKKNAGVASLNHDHCPGGQKLLVPIDKLDSYHQIWEAYEQILVKIDVEGAELLVLHGGTQLFNSDRHVCLIIEQLRESDFDTALKVTNQLAQWGYHLCDKEWQAITSEPANKNANYFYTR